MDLQYEKLVDEPAVDEVAERIVQARAAAGFTQHRLSWLLDVPQTMLCRYENGHSMPGTLKLAQIAAHCHTTIEWLFLGIGAAPKPAKKARKKAK